jgi:hypothetical protein
LAMSRRPGWAVLCGAGAIALLSCPARVNQLTDIAAATWLHYRFARGCGLGFPRPPITI